MFKSCKFIFENIILFVNYIKFNPQSFNCYIFCFESFYLFIYFQSHPLEFYFYINFGIFLLIVICFSLIIFFIEIFLFIRFGPHSFYCYLFYLK